MHPPADSIAQTYSRGVGRRGASGSATWFLTYLPCAPRRIPTPTPTRQPARFAAGALIAVPFARSPYFQGSILAVYERPLGAFSTKVYARVAPGNVGDASFVMKLSWV